MAFVVKSGEREPAAGSPGVTRAWVLRPDRLSDGRMAFEAVTLDSGATLDLYTDQDELLWFQVLAGSVDVDGATTGREFIVMISGGRAMHLAATEATELMVVRVPRASAYDPAVREGLARRVDWSTEPVLDSEHDTRRRIYLASTGLWGTEAVKGEMIYYPPGSSGAPHHHEGAEHFQFIVSGSGTALLDGEPVDLEAGDLLYNYENEIHAFRNDGDEDFVFVEFFVPGASRTVWVPGVHVCTWRPRETDVLGRPAARVLEPHVHGQGQV